MKTTTVVLSGADFGGLTVDWPDKETEQRVTYDNGEGPAVYVFRRVMVADRFGDTVPTNAAVFVGLEKP